MFQPLSQSAQRGVLVLVASLSALFLSYFSIRNARAAHFAALQTPEGLDRATRLEPGDASNWYQLGRYWQYSLENSDAQRAIRAYLSALSFNPRSAGTWLDLATAYESEGNLTAARDAFLHAKRAYPLSADASWRYGNFLLR
jgi:Tfp pilus assembly protein PilF